MPLPKAITPEERKARWREDYLKRRDRILAQKREKSRDPKWQAERRAYYARPAVRAHRRAQANKQYAEDPAYRESRKQKTAQRRNTPEGRKRNCEQAAAWREKNVKRHKATKKRWQIKTRDKHNAYMRVYKKARFANDPAFKVAEYTRRRVRLALQGHPKAGTTEKLVGCSWEQLREWLEAQFLPGMTWSNHGEWHIDHIRACAKFDLFDPVQQRLCFHFSNLQPLWGLYNIRKGSR